MPAGAPDYFSFQAGLYARSRPRYPDALMRWLVRTGQARRYM